MDPFQPEYLILHDYGGTPGLNPKFNPYHALVSGGGISYRNPQNPYGQAAPHAYKLNPRSIGLSWGGPVGGNPSKEEFALLKKEYDAIKKQFPNIKVLSHGEAYQQTRGTGQQASKHGRGLEEAAWRQFLEGGVYDPGTNTPLPVSQRGITRVAGVQKTQPMTTEPLETMPTYKNVGGQTYMGPDRAQASQKLAQMLIANSQQQEPMTHWTQALGNVLMAGSGALRNDMAMRDIEQGQTSGNQALGRMLMGGVPEQAAAVSNPYSSERALKYVMDQKTATDQTPSNVREYEYFSKLTPEQQTQYLNVKRQNMGVYGDTIFNKVTGAPVANLGDALKRGKIAEGEGANVAKLRAELPGEKARLGMINGVLDRLDKAANDLRTQPGLETVAGGLYQAYAPNVSEKALNAQTNLENLKVQISGQVLQSMREMSKTGGAVGQVTEREWPRLENMIANLDPRQGVAQFRTNLDAINNYVAEVKARLREAYEADLATAQGGGAQMPPIDVPQGVKEYVYDPATGKVVPK